MPRANRNPFLIQQRTQIMRMDRPIIEGDHTPLFFGIARTIEGHAGVLLELFKRIAGELLLVLADGRQVRSSNWKELTA